MHKNDRFHFLMQFCVYSLLNIIDKIQQRKNNVYLTLVGQGNHHFKTNDNFEVGILFHIPRSIKL